MLHESAAVMLCLTIAILIHASPEIMSWSPCRPGTGGSMQTSASMGADNMSMVSGYTYATATTFKTKASQPDFTRIPNEYEKVGGLLRLSWL